MYLKRNKKKETQWNGKPYRIWRVATIQGYACAHCLCSRSIRDKFKYKHEIYLLRILFSDRQLIQSIAYLESDSIWNNIFENNFTCILYIWEFTTPIYRLKCNGLWQQYTIMAWMNFQKIISHLLIHTLFRYRRFGFIFTVYRKKNRFAYIQISVCCSFTFDEQANERANERVNPATSIICASKAFVDYLIIECHTEVA